MELGSVYDRRRDPIGELQWAHQTMIRLIGIVQFNGLLTDELRECICQLTKASVLLEGLIQAHLSTARRRMSDNAQGS